jgi:hypothetical protein
MRDVVLAQHCGQLGVRQYRVVVHGRRDRHWEVGDEGRGRGPEPGHTGRVTVCYSRQRQRQRLGSGRSASHCVTLTSQPRAL